VSGETWSETTGGPVAPAGWGAAPSFLPPAVAVRMRQSDAKEAIAAREAEAEQETRREELHQRALSLYAEQATARGELLSAVALATGQVRGRSIADILEAARLAGDREDLVTEARLRREGHGDPAQLTHVEVAEPVILTSPVKRSIASRSRRWQAWREKVAAAEAARRAVEADRAAFASRNDIGLVDGVTIRPREDRDAVVFARHAAASRPVSYR
jgi:hypothetical protein